MAVIITFTLFLGIVIPVSYGEVRSSILTKIEAEKLAREKLSLNKDFQLQHGNLNTRDMEQRQYWNLEFKENKRNISVVMSAESGEIISVNQWDRESYGKTVTILEEDANKIGIDFIKSLEPERYKETEAVTVNAPTVIPYDIKTNYVDNNNYYFMFVRKINGEFFPNNYFTVTVSGVNGKVTAYEMKWDDAAYVNKANLLSEDKAREIFEKEDRLKLKYVALNKYNQEENKNLILTPVYVYTPKDTDKIDAVTGRLLSYDELYNWNYYGYPTYGGGLDTANKEEAETAADMGAEMIPEKGVISKEKAIEIVFNMLKDHVDLEGVKINSTSYTNYMAGIEGKFWSLHGHSNEGNNYLRSVVNAENGQVLELIYTDNEEDKPIGKFEDSEGIKESIINNDDSLKLADEKIKAIFPKTKDGLKLESQTSSPNNGNIVFVSGTRYINNIPFDDNHAQIGFNIETSKITNLNYRWYDVEVQKGNSLISKEKAHDIFYDKVGFEKYLVQLKDLEKYEKEGLELPIKDLLPVYGLKNFNFTFVDGLTGKLLTYSGEEFKEENNKNQFTDIANSPYMKEILLMDKMGILKVTESAFKPEEALLRKDALKWIIETGWSNKAFPIESHYGSTDNDKNFFKDITKEDPYYKYIKTAIELGIIDAGEYFKPDEQISKLELTKWIINAMKQKELAEYSSIFQMPYKDGDSINVEDTGYVALAKYYNIFGDKNIEGEFEPTRNFNRGEFVHYMYDLILDYKNIK